MTGTTLYTERGDVHLNAAQMRLYTLLAARRFDVLTNTELCAALGLGSRALDCLADTLRASIAAATGLRMVQNVWGIGYRLEDLPPHLDPYQAPPPTHDRRPKQ